MIENPQAKLRRLQLEQQADDNAVKSDIKALKVLVENQSETSSDGAAQSPIINLLRNTDASHSVETWWHTSPTAGNQNEECAQIYTTEPLEPKISATASMTGGNATLTIEENAFASGVAGSLIIVEGAGAGSTKLMTTIDAYISPTQVSLSDAAVTTVTNAKVRWGLTKFQRRNTISDPATLENDALKTAAHPDYAADINDPDWMRSGGAIRLGSTNPLVFFLGTYDDESGTEFRPSIYGFNAGRDLFFIAKIAKAHKGVKARGRFYVGIYNNDSRNLEFLAGGRFKIEAEIKGTPAATATTKYLVIAHTDRGYDVFTDILTVPNAPALNAYIPGQTEILLEVSPPVPAVLTYTIYRRIGTGNVELIGIVPNSDTHFTDNNPIDRIDTGSTEFPSRNADNTIKAYIATSIGDFDNLAVDKHDDWADLLMQIPMSRTTDLSEATELAIVAGLTEPLSLEVTDAISSGANITSESAFFDAAKHAGKRAIITDRADASHTFETTVLSVTNAATLVLAAAPDWTGTNTLEIFDGEPRGLYLDLLGLSFNSGSWSPHPDDNASRRQLVAALPNGSTQGGVGTGGTSGIGGGGVLCFAWYGTITDFETREEFLANDLQPGRKIFNGTDRPSIVKSVKRSIVHNAFVRETESGARSVPTTASHRGIRGTDDLKTGLAVGEMRAGENCLRFVKNEFIIDKIKSIVPVDFSEGLLVVSVGFEENESDLFSRAFLLGDFLDHNLKDGGGNSSVQN